MTRDDGKVNATSLEILAEIAQRVDEASGCGGPVALQGRPGIFSAGFDLKTLPADPSPRSP
jgi:enoyl-CoA hydratase